MIEMAEEFPVYLRVLTKPKGNVEKQDSSDMEAAGKEGPKLPNDNLLLVFDTETTTDLRQDLRFGVARIYAFGNLTRTVLFYEKVTEAERATISCWAAARGFDCLPREEFVCSVLLPVADKQRGVVVGFNLPSTSRDSP